MPEMFHHFGASPPCARAHLLVDVHENIYQLAFSCWGKDPESRPTIHSLHDSLVALLAEEAAHLPPARDVGALSFEPLDTAHRRSRRR